MKTLKILIALFITLGFTTLANAQMTTGKDTGPVVLMGLPCIGEDLAGTVTYHYSYRTLDNPANRFEVHWSSQGGVLIGQTSGKIYRWNFQSNENGKILPIELANGAWTWRIIQKIRIIGTGKDAVNTSIDLLGKVTILPTGELKLEFWNFTDWCQ